VQRARASSAWLAPGRKETHYDITPFPHKQFIRFVRNRASRYGGLRTDHRHFQLAPVPNSATPPLFLTYFPRNLSLFPPISPAFEDGVYVVQREWLLIRKRLYVSCDSPYLFFVQLKSQLLCPPSNGVPTGEFVGN
jgi:hypothetical protein